MMRCAYGAHLIPSPNLSLRERNLTSHGYVAAFLAACAKNSGIPLRGCARYHGRACAPSMPIAAATSSIPARASFASARAKRSNAGTATSWIEIALSMPT